jgi:hypothetical protein
MKYGAHKRALTAIYNNLFAGSVQEITHKPNWGFFELKPDNKVIGKALGDFFVNRIFHILIGEGVNYKLIEQNIKWALKNTLRILILEHEPNGPDFFGLNKNAYDALEIFLSKTACPVTKIDIDGRNILYVITALDEFDDFVNCLNDKNLEFFKAVRYRNLPFAGEEIYRVSSERQDGNGHLLSSADREKLRAIQYPYYSVVGGMMFLNAIAEIGKRDIVLFDLSIKQLLYAKAVIDTIRSSTTVALFDEALKKYNAPDVMSYLWDGLTQAIRTVPDEKNEWIDIVRKGVWRKDYEKVREILLGNVSYQLKSAVQIKYPKESIAYLSTIPKSDAEKCKAKYRVTISPTNNIPVMETS